MYICMYVCMYACMYVCMYLLPIQCPIGSVVVFSKGKSKCLISSVIIMSRHFRVLS